MPSSSPTTVRVLLNTTPGGFVLSPAVLRELFAQAPQLFDEALAAEDMQTPGAELSLEELYPNCVQVGDKLYPLLNREAAVRTFPWLLEQYDKRGATALVGQYAGTLRAVEVPAEVRWTIWENEDGTEAVHEVHRVWS